MKTLLQNMIINIGKLKLIYSKSKVQQKLRNFFFERVLVRLYAIYFLVEIYLYSTDPSLISLQ